jgi:hypothetical protein
MQQPSGGIDVTNLCEYKCNDCAHYTAALRLLNRSKYADSTKAQIKACINRKGKQLGCTKKEKSSDIDALIKKSQFAVTLKTVEASIKDPGRDFDFYLKQVLSQY